MHRFGAAALAAAVFAAGLHWGTFAVGGSDSYCYVHQAQGWSTGRLQVVEPLALDAPWPDAPRTFAPAGHVPSATVPGAAVPMCPAGLSIAMAPFMLVDNFLARRLVRRSAAREVGSSQSEGWRRPDAIFLVVPLFGALLVWSVYVLGSRFGRRVGLASALLVACSPAFLFQLVQPMSDVPAAALWVLALACATGSRPHGPVTAGFATSVAILMRPNLLPLGITIGAFLLARGFVSRCGTLSRVVPESDSGATRHPSLTPAAIFALASAPGCLAVATIQQVLYGSPFRSGYGSLDMLFSSANVAPNAARYFEWLWQSHTPAWLLALAAPLVLPGWLTALLLTFAIVNVACYLPYVVFNDWWYLRFMLPAIAVLLVLMVATIDSIAARAFQARDTQSSQTHRVRAALLGVFAAAMCFVFIREARARSVFDLPRLESRYERAGRYVDQRLPDNALVITSWESGSVRFYSNRKTLVWDALDPAWLDRAIAFSRTRGLEPYLLFERWEEPLFRQRFAGSSSGALDWPPAAEIAGQVRIYRPEDRDRYLKGEGTPTEYSR